ncbi:hypothetical protein RRG08_062997 [Elysia crispata]|uniref:Uncharacterized protein n=1 Tax=Elysia crispata TaxID=231223 RepID=A0AAE1CYK4_9GAST|nr:hypothetical protein RRG08_062997 [Elysia crispata]
MVPVQLSFTGSAIGLPATIRVGRSGEKFLFLRGYPVVCVSVCTKTGDISRFLRVFVLRRGISRGLCECLHQDWGYPVVCVSVYTRIGDISRFLTGISRGFCEFVHWVEEFLVVSVRICARKKDISSVNVSIRSSDISLSPRLSTTESLQPPTFSQTF